MIIKNEAQEPERAKQNYQVRGLFLREKKIIELIRAKEREEIKIIIRDNLPIIVEDTVKHIVL